MSKQFYFKRFSLAEVSRLNIVKYQKLISNNSVYHNDKIYFYLTHRYDSGPGSDGNEEALRILQSSSITEALP